MLGNYKNKLNVKGSAKSGSQAIMQTKHQHVFQVDAYDPDGNHKWTDFIYNTVVNEGLDDILDKYYKGSSYTAAHYIGLADSTPSFSAGDTLGASANSWSEVTGYDEASRQDFTPGTVSSQSVDNSASKASFTITSDSTTIGGAFVATDNTKGGDTGVLVGGGAFSGGDKTLGSGDTLSVQVTASASSS